jgi:hypothetical protein
MNRKKIVIVVVALLVIFGGIVVYTMNRGASSMLVPMSPEENALENVSVADTNIATTSTLISADDSVRTEQDIYGGSPKPVVPVTQGTALKKESEAPQVAETFPWKKAIATVFWVGEGESTENGYIHNRASAWDEQWEKSFGGEDDPENRCGFNPCSFTPKQNPFYVALPYIERNEDETVKKSARAIPWYTDALFRNGTLLRGRWVEVRSGSVSCFGQWEDVGPFETDDFAYVFGTADTPQNVVDARAGIDLSPALRDCLRVEDVSTVEWRFVGGNTVPVGPWTFAQE